ncbi:helix-turn-helix transcriptional regulator [Streptomyces bacillaris]|uniref:helix-turn-helix transcriptional regulator n=1 Tax=Streptomyces bacillaris TaxID=68179 RepID=UPI003346906B
MLQTWGVGLPADQVYRTMLRQPGIDVAGLTESLGLEETEVRRALDTLADLALIRTSCDKPGAVYPVNPELGFQAILAKRQAEIARRQQALEEAKAQAASVLAHYMLEYTAGRVGVELLSGLDAVRLRLQELAATTEQEALSLAPGGPQTAANRVASQPLAESLLARSVAIRTIYLDSVRNDPASVKHALWLCDRGAHIRTVPFLPTRMQILDRRVALLPLHVEQTDKGALLVEEPGIVAVLSAFFDMLWAQASPMGAVIEPQDELSPQDRELMRLLGQGLTDEAVARKLGVSLRTERRMVTRLSEHLNAQSRFQLGQRAVERGLL